MRDGSVVIDIYHLIEVLVVIPLVPRFFCLFDRTLYFAVGETQILADAAQI